MKTGKSVKDRKNRLVFNYNNKNYTYDEIYRKSARKMPPFKVAYELPKNS